jgi:hypothetical protein
LKLPESPWGFAENRMRAAVMAHIRFHVDNQKKVLISDSALRGLGKQNFKIIVKMQDRYERMFQDLIQAGIEEGIFTSWDIKIVSYAVLSMCTGVANWFNSSGRLKKENIAEIYTNFVMKGLKNESLPLLQDDI